MWSALLQCWAPFHFLCLLRDTQPRGRTGPVAYSGVGEAMCHISDNGYTTGLSAREAAVNWTERSLTASEYWCNRAENRGPRVPESRPPGLAWDSPAECEAQTCMGTMTQSRGPMRTETTGVHARTGGPEIHGAASPWAKPSGSGGSCSLTTVLSSWLGRRISQPKTIDQGTATSLTLAPRRAFFKFRFRIC